MINELTKSVFFFFCFQAAHSATEYIATVRRAITLALWCRQHKRNDLSGNHSRLEPSKALVKRVNDVYVDSSSASRINERAVATSRRNSTLEHSWNE